jgi:hypothetical protein
MKLNPGLNILLYFQKTSTVITVFGLTILIDNEAKIISNIIAGTNQAAQSGDIINQTGTTIKAKGTINQSIFLKLILKYFQIIFYLYLLCKLFLIF